VRLKNLQALRAVARRENPASFTFKHSPQHVPKRIFIVNNEDGIAGWFVQHGVVSLFRLLIMPNHGKTADDRPKFPHLVVRACHP
jgi:hypothetical protein